jgi:hypothetical protein
MRKRASCYARRSHDHVETIVPVLPWALGDPACAYTAQGCGIRRPNLADDLACPRIDALAVHLRTDVSAA